MKPIRWKLKKQIDVNGAGGGLKKTACTEREAKLDQHGGSGL